MKREALESSSTCPRCARPLRAGRYREVPCATCPDCHGLWVEQRSLRALLELMAVDALELLDPDTPLEALADAGGGLGCPPIHRSVMSC